MRRMRPAALAFGVLGVGVLVGMAVFGEGSAGGPPPEEAPTVTGADAPDSGPFSAQEAHAQLPDREVDGVDSNSKIAAQRAAVRFLELTEDVVALSPEEGAAVQRSISAHDAADELVAGVLDTLVSLQAEVPEGVVVHIAPLGVGAVERGDGWDVSIWYVEVIIYGDQLTVEQWRTATYAMVWEDDGWLMSGLESVAGPTPVRTAATTASSTPALLAGTEALDDEVLVP